MDGTTIKKIIAYCVRVCVLFRVTINCAEILSVTQQWFLYPKQYLMIPFSGFAFALYTIAVGIAVWSLF